jgi:hypothetical protein
MKEARTAVERLHRIDPSLRTSNLKNALFFRRPEDIAKLVKGLQTAGLP